MRSRAPSATAAITDQLRCDPRARGHAARAWVEREFGWDRVFDQMFELYGDPGSRRRARTTTITSATPAAAYDR